MTKFELMDKLTPREREIVESILLGESQKETAARLNISVSTVRHHRANIYQRIGASGKGPYQGAAEIVRICRFSS